MEIPRIARSMIVKKLKTYLYDTKLKNKIQAKRNSDKYVFTYNNYILDKTK